MTASRDSSATVELRLRRLDALADELRRRELASGAMAEAVSAVRRAARMDMAPAAIERRLRELSELRDLCLALQTASRDTPRRR